MKTAYHVGLFGNSEKVLDGTWKDAFDDSAEGPTEGTKGGPAGLNKHESADGTEENHAHHETPTKSHKRDHSQSKLDFGSSKKTKK